MDRNRNIEHSTPINREQAPLLRSQAFDAEPPSIPAPPTWMPARAIAGLAVGVEPETSMEKRG
jgi:hypothetical protein